MTDRRQTAAGAATQLGTQVSLNLGSSLAGLAIPAVGTAIIVAARQLVMLAIVLPVSRPRFRTLSWRTVWPALALGVVLVTMNTAYYQSIHLLGLGVAATLEFLGPFAVALFSSRRLIDVVCAVAVGAGVVMLTGFDGAVNVLGVALALLAAASWAAYILLARRAALTLPGLQGLGIAGVVSVAVLLPLAIASLPGAQFSWEVILLLVLIGVLSSALPYSLDSFILRRISARLYAIISAFGPVIAAVFGWLVLNESLTALQVVAILMVCAAACVAITTQRPARKSRLQETAEIFP
ncbi:EamA family transporter [Paramicrobacterium agarici]|uniref:Inner membrane transporter RhtA n=1 Tax=Paramicrobacterium agarici TaxID=630514 RepID=A0A2A9DZD7_9MICO|nr:EamA family transporter [Microbacterium agarici]PFG32167.1 inner membrane transporter RhtA [Microbacterium agarici]